MYSEAKLALFIYLWYPKTKVYIYKTILVNLSYAFALVILTIILQLL